MAKTKAVWKYIVPITDEPQHFEIPVNAVPVMVGSEVPGTVTVWCEVDPSERKANRYLRVFGTGHEIPGSAQYWGSTIYTIDPELGLVWHLYRVMPADRL